MRNIAAAVEFGTSKVICIVGRAKSIGRFEVLGSGVARYEGIKGGRWQKPENVDNAVAKALYLAEGIDAGMVHVNDGSVDANASCPFGGVKQSGRGREGGQYSLNEMTELKWVTLLKQKRPLPF
jgi:cell division ATPase FtsA